MSARAYAPIEMDSSVPSSVAALVSDRIEPKLRDVRKMLEARGGAEPASDFSIVIVLCSIVGGLARVFHRTQMRDAHSFRAVAARYPLADEPLDAIRNPGAFAAGLYEVNRCNLVHSLGLSVDKSPDRARWEIVDSPAVTKVTRQEPLPLTDQQVVELEGAALDHHELLTRLRGAGVDAVELRVCRL